MKLGRILWAGLLCSVLAATAIGQIRRQGAAYSFRAKYKKGSTISYDFITLVLPYGSPSGATSQKLSLPVLMRILDIKNGVAKIQSDAGPIKLNGKDFRPKTRVIVHVDSLNRLVGVGDQEIPQFTTPLPEKPLKIGQSWSAVIDPSDNIPYSMTVNAKYRLAKVDRYYAFIAVSLTGKGTGMSKISTTGQGTMVLRKVDGTLHSLKMTQTVIAAEGAGAKSTITVTRKA